MTYEQTLSYLYEQLPMFTRIGKAAFKKDLTNTLALCKVLGDPQNSFRSVHIAGTNGKGSTSHMLASVLQEAGYKTGLYTSPHLKDFRERIRTNGQMIPEDPVISFVEKYRTDFESIAPSFFEWTVALCFHWFSLNRPDIAIIETGLGGRLDSTNVISPMLSVITNIGWDHTDMLGDTLEKIAAEKAGIIKNNVPVVIGETQQETKNVFRQKALETGSPVFFADQELHTAGFKTVRNGVTCDILSGQAVLFGDLFCDLGGIYQQRNILTVCEALIRLRHAGFIIPDEAVYKGLANVKTNTGLMGRWQVLNEAPYTVCDTGHNVNGISYVLEQIGSVEFRKLHIVMGMVRDKDIAKVLAMFPRNAVYYFCNASIPRALPSAELAEQAAAYGLKGEAYPTVSAAYRAAQKNASADDMIFIGGSTFVVAEVL